MATLEEKWVDAAAPNTLYSANANAGTYQSSAGNLGKLHVLTASDTVRIEGGTGGSVSAITGLIWAGLTPYYFFPKQSRESIGWEAYGGSAIDVTVAIVDDA